MDSRTRLHLRSPIPLCLPALLLGSLALGFLGGPTEARAEGSRVTLKSFDVSTMSTIVDAGAERQVRQGDKGAIFQWVTIGSSREAFLVAEFVVVEVKSRVSIARLVLKRNVSSIALDESFAEFERVLPTPTTREGRSCLVWINSTPPGASVTLDEEPLKKTPLCINRIRPGKHRIVVKKARYFEAARVFHLRPEGGEKIEIQLQPIPRKIILKVEASPPGAVVYVDDQSIGEVVGLEPKRRVVDPGRHVIRVEAEGHTPITKALTLEEDRTVAISLKASPMVEIASTPAGAAVFLDGKEVGRTPYRGDAGREGYVRVSLRHDLYLVDEFEMLAEAGKLTRTQRRLTISPEALDVERTKRRWMAYGGLIGGGVATVTAAALLGLSVAKHLEADRAHQDYLAVSCGSDAFETAYDGIRAPAASARTYAIASYSTLAAGALGLGFGIWQLVRLNELDDVNVRGDGGKPEAMVPRLFPIAGGDFTGIGVSVGFQGF